MNMHRRYYLLWSLLSEKSIRVIDVFRYSRLLRQCFNENCLDFFYGWSFGNHGWFLPNQRRFVKGEFLREILLIFARLLYLSGIGLSVYTRRFRKVLDEAFRFVLKV